MFPSPDLTGTSWSLYKVNGTSSKLLFYKFMQYLFSSGALKQIESGLWDADDTTLALKCQLKFVFLRHFAQY